MGSHFEQLIGKIDGFIRRYYLNRLIRGGILFASGFLLMLLVFTLLEYFGYFSSLVRGSLFYLFVLYNLLVMLFYVIMPLLGMLKIGRKLDEKQAARLIGEHFRSEIADKITNALELKQYLDKNPDNEALILAGLEQKAASANPLPLHTAINLRSNLRLLPFFVLPFLIVAGIILVSPGFITEPAKRIVQYDQFFEKPAPFSLNMVSPGAGFRGEDLEIILESKGAVMPSEVRIRYQSGRFRMEQKQRGVFAHTLKNLRTDIVFYAEAGGYVFGPYLIRARQKAVFSRFGIRVENPSYTGLPEGNFDNAGDILVAQGADIHWDFVARSAEAILFEKGDQIHRLEPGPDGRFHFSSQAMESFSYRVIAWNNDSGRGDSLQYQIRVRPDAFPSIQASVIKDSLWIAYLFHQGSIADDYGFSSLEFHYRIEAEGQAGSGGSDYMVERIPIDAASTNQNFYYHIDTRKLGMLPGSRIEYFFRVYDNDRINGFKASGTPLFVYSLPGAAELLARDRETSRQIQDDLSGGRGEVRRARDEIEAIRRQMLQSERMTWQQQESLRNMLEKQQEMQGRMQELGDMKRENEIRNRQFGEEDEKILEKQEELQRLFEEVMSEEMKALFEKIRQELENLDRSDVYEMLSRMEFEFRDLENRMDRALELFRQLEMERMLQQSINKLNQLAEEQKDLRQQTEQLQKDNAAKNDTSDKHSELQSQQEKLSEEFDMIRDLLEEMSQKNQALNRPRKMEDTSPVQDAIEKFMKDAGEQLNKNQPDRASPSQKGAEQGMQDLSQTLQGMQQDMFMQQMAEDARSIREILENLLKTSFAQEDLLLETRTISPNDPRYVSLIQDQRKLRDDLKMIEDSLVAISKRQIEVQGFIMREIAEINMNIDVGIHQLIERQRGQANSRQQFVMTHINNLALMLNESLKNMQMQMQMAMQGSGESGQGGMGGEPSFNNTREMQEALNKMLEQMQGGQTPQRGDSENQMSESEAFARMAAEQERIRREIQRLRENAIRDGLGDGSELLEMQRMMEQTELELVRKQISSQMIFRQQQILTRLLEHERAEQQQEEEERRVGNTAKNYELSNPEQIFEYNRIRGNELELLRRLPPGMNPWYRNLVEKYLLGLPLQEN